MHYAFGEFILDTETGELLRAGEVVALRRQTFRLLTLLIERAPALLSRDTLLDEVWGRTALAPNAVPQAISELRRALGDDAQAPQYIETRHGRGYRFLASVQRHTTHGADILSTDSAVPAQAFSPSQPKPTKSGQRAAYIALLGAILIVGGWLGSVLVVRKYTAITTPPTPVTTLVLASLPANAGVPDWVSPAALELFGQHLEASRLRLLRGDALGLADSVLDTRWQHQAHDLLGAQFAAGGRWRQQDNGNLVLDLSVIDLADGHVVSSRRIEGAQEDLDTLVREASTTIASALRIAPADDQPAPLRLRAADGEQYGNALRALSEGRAAAAAATLAELHERLDRPRWMDSTLIEALVQTGDREAALALLNARLNTNQSLPLGERLRLQAEVARLRHDPVAAAASLRALVDLYPDDVDSLLGLITAEINALQGTSARKTLARLASLPAAHSDPRTSLLRSQLARLDNDFTSAQREAAAALQIARQYDLPKIAFAAAIAESDALRGHGKLDEGARLLAGIDEVWASRVDASTLLELRIRRIQLLREQGRLTEAQSLLDHLPPLPANALPRARIGIEAALLQTQLGQPADANSNLQRIKPIVDAAKDPDLDTAWLNADAFAAIARNDVEHAQQAFAEAFTLARSKGRAGQHVALQVNAGLALMRQKRYVEADQQWQQALDTFESLGDRRGQATCLGNLAASASTQGQLERSVELNVRALDLFRSLHLSGSQARTAYNLALAAMRDGKLEQAGNYFSESADAWKSDGQHDLALRAAVGQADVVLSTGRPDAAQRILDTATNVEEASPLSRSHALAMAAAIVLTKGELDASRRLHEQAQGLRTQDGNQGWIALSELELLRNDLLAGADATRVQIGSESLARRFADLGERRDEARAWLLVTDAQLSRKKVDDARRSLGKAQRAAEAFADRNLSFDLEWAEAWVGASDERTLRLRALHRRASDQGYVAQAMRVERALALDPAESSGAFSRSIPVPPYARDHGMRPAL